MKNFLLLSALSFLTFNLFSQVDTTVIKSEEVNLNQVYMITSADLESDEQPQDISGLLQSSRDIFISTAGFTFSQTRFRIRGYDSENTTVLLGGVPLNDMETGRAYWSAWGGLNDVTRSQEVNFGISASPYSFGGISGSVNISLVHQNKDPEHGLPTLRQTEPIATG